ncbi:MAG: hypothetical protein L0Y44_15830 [Phycisphaerales bacterium]|nr:hypothetical protein [Phycisphaerales bacterium]MCI0632113.1 hypothetical protein [Phycisphaerales bacterium]MCI0675301.1 hypothetical protein [Phycisphaerales bacterium]
MNKLLPLVTIGLLVSVAIAQELPTPPPRRPTGPVPEVKPPGGRKVAEQLVQIRSTADVDRVHQGQKFHLAFIFDIEPDWHIYWKNSGASGGPTTIQVTAPPGYGVGKTLYPRPIAMKGEEGVTYGYEKQTVIFVEVTAPIEPLGGVAAFSAKINYMVCKDICMIGRPPLQMINVETASGRAPEGDGDSTVDPIISVFKSRLPKPLNDAAGAKTEFDGSTLTVRLPSQGKTTGEFFPLEVPGVTYGEAAVSVEGSVLQFKVPVTVNPNDAMGKKMVVAGDAGLGTSQSDPCYQFEIPLPAS